MYNCLNLQAISCHYASSHCQYIDIRGTSQENLAEELKELARKRYGNDFEVTFEVKSFLDYYKYPVFHLTHVENLVHIIGINIAETKLR